ncbi:cytochrome c [Alsobacter sp. SYSU M60028]|uniref:Cytochrome c n=1 Tax=Alsobacter ponti TaxID=2962936 RepID=A0ABT1LBX5_9HYPH|nr:cytochrome c [Alsobacter ponti]MCP8938466.1 cytochrome c [Alsobacter ponti]
MKLRRVVIALTVLVAAAAPAAAADISAGRELARKWCSECHVLGAVPSGAPGQGPAFADVARMPSTTGLSLSVFLRSSHANMPNLILTPTESDDLVAYILSLAGKS